jgi:hypothetical protein
VVTVEVTKAKITPLSLFSEDKNLLTSMAVFRVSALPPIGNPESYRCLIASNDQ